MTESDAARVLRRMVAAFATGDAHDCHEYIAICRPVDDQHLPMARAVIVGFSRRHQRMSEKRMRFSIGTCATLVVTVLTGCQTRTTMPLAGSCWDIEVLWDNLGSDSLEFLPPPRVMLDTSEVDATERRLLVEAPGSLPSIHRIAFWRLIAGNDSLELVWSTGFAGIVVRLPIGGDTLAGWAEEFTDQFMPDPPRTNSVAERVSCGAPLPDAIRERRPDLIVPVGDRADVLRIGAPLPASVSVQAEPVGYFLLATEPAGIYRGADSVRAYLGPDRALNAVFLTYTDTSAFNRVVAALRSQLGPPFGRLASRLDDLSWIDREMWIRADPSRCTVTVASPKEMW